MRWLMYILVPSIVLAFYSYKKSDSRLQPKTEKTGKQSATNPVHPLSYPSDSWQSFLQHLPTENKPIVDYKGNQIYNQQKHFAILTYDIGTTDLQQCADALIRLRSEYLFSQKKYTQIGFHFNSGIYYRLMDYLQGVHPIFRNGQQVLVQTGTVSELSHTSLRKWLDIVYTYANTVSLCKELKKADGLQTGTVIIFPGNPGHCCIIIDEAITDKRDTVYKLAEGYMPAQSMYVLSNPFEPEWNPWYHLGKAEINTASCSFRSYYLKKFE
ncbi:MAG TPA: DUF4846 domain-containing protein [Puia sp.]|nr:DUF4846 domain-containing protein [Puia sp.]